MVKYDIKNETIHLLILLILNCRILFIYFFKLKTNKGC